MGFDPEKITFFAKTDARGQDVKFGIKAKDRQRHMYIIGKTGMGKSTLLENMAVQDIQNGEGMAFIDPHGSAAETLLEYVPEDRVNDVIYFAPFDLDNPISFNVMEDVGPDKRHLVVSGLMSTFKKIWVDAWSARMEYILTNALLALIEYPDTTLLSVNRLFSDKNYRKQVVDYIKDPAVKSFWTEEFANYTDRFAAEALPAIQNKIGQFTGNPLIRNIIGQPHSSFDIRKIMDEKKILIMNLSKGLVGETNANLLGSMLTTRIYLAAMSRADLSVAEMKKMPNFYFYVDEFQSFANATFANILSEARKYHLNLIIAHQYIEQMEEEVRDAVFGNVGTTITFRVGPFDAEVLETVFTPRFLAPDLVNLGFAQVYLTLMIDGIGSQPFSAVTLPPIAPPRISCKNMVIAASRRNYTKPRGQVEKIVTELHAPVVVEVKPKRVNETETGGKNSAYQNDKNNYNSKARNNEGKTNNKNRVYLASKPDTLPSTDVSNKETPAVVSVSVGEETKVVEDISQTINSSANNKPKERMSAHRFTKESKTKTTSFSTSPSGQTEKSSEELRSVLAKIANQNKTSSEHKVTEEETAIKGKSGAVANSSALRSALALALETMPANPKTTNIELPEKKTASASLTEMEKLINESEVAMAELEAKTTKETFPDTPDPKQITKILKDTGHTHSPFK